MGDWRNHTVFRCASGNRLHGGGSIRVLSDRIEAYESRHFPAAEVEPVDFLHAMDMPAARRLTSAMFLDPVPGPSRFSLASARLRWK
ncbi:hypothetical protein IE4872_CH02601 [Rhizobium gallicum]|uniref:Uncharacterized protein n=1 Tax=Rhizobium gallicum TaxID=56730 RepID=A0A1L5NJX1_9HYPH|nr:hypothetical protein IE4872_CH02601 [Rhizobium gallicum]